MTLSIEMRLLLGGMTAFVAMGFIGAAVTGDPLVTSPGASPSSAGHLHLDSFANKASEEARICAALVDSAGQERSQRFCAHLGTGFLDTRAFPNQRLSCDGSTYGIWVGAAWGGDGRSDYTDAIWPTPCDGSSWSFEVRGGGSRPFVINRV